MAGTTLGPHMSRTRNILVIYACEVPELRATTWNHLYCFERHSRHRTYYLNVAARRLPGYLRQVRWDLIVFDTLLMCNRWNRDGFRRILDRVQELSTWDVMRCALPQDEFISTDLLSEFVSALQLDVVFSVAPPSEWPTIYEGVDRSRVRIERVLTGYLDDSILDRPRPADGARSIDIGYRTAGRPYPWFGRFGYKKQEIADLFLEYGPRWQLKLDISTRNEDTILGDSWYAFLSDSRYTLGAEGGTSILDRDGTIHARTLAYGAAHPEASFEEVEAACFPGLDGSFGLRAISPRHLEACATRTGQILVRGEYNGILEADRHYLPLEPDFSNIDAVLSEVADERRRLELVEAAYEEVVRPGRYHYREFVRSVEDATLGAEANSES